MMLKPIIFYIKNTKTGEKKKRYIGNIIEKAGVLIYEKKINPNRHTQYNMKSFAIDAKTFTKKILNVCARIEIFDSVNNNLYVTTPLNFKEKGQYKHFIDDRGWDYRAEIFLPVEEFRVFGKFIESDGTEGQYA